MKDVVLMAYDNASKGSKELAAALHIRRLKHEGSKWEPSPQKTIINWGSSKFVKDELDVCRVINHPVRVHLCANKLHFFTTWGANCQPDELELVVPWTTDPRVVQGWFQEGYTVCARKKLTGNSGEGLVLFDGTCEFVMAPLYTRYVKKKQEYRIHATKQKVFLVQEKRRKKDGPDGVVAERAWPQGMIRNHENGYVFARKEVDPPDCVVNAGLRAVNIMGLDFGAVDVIYNQKYDRAYVLEINTAPGLEGSTIDDYTNMLKEIL